MRILALALTGALALTSLQAASAQTRIQPMQAKPPVPQGLNLQKNAPKPDFVILDAGPVGGSDTDFMVKVKNAGAVNSPKAQLRGTNKAPGNTGSAVVEIPAIKAGGFEWVGVVLDRPARPGNRILIEADYNKAVPEAKENNNNYGFSW